MENVRQIIKKMRQLSWQKKAQIETNMKLQKERQ